MGHDTNRTLKIWLLKGLPGSGKSTWAKDQVKAFPTMYKRVNKDELRAMIDDGQWSKDREQFVLRIRNEVIRESLTAGYDILVDDTNLHEKHRQTMDVIAGEFPGTLVVEKMFDTPLEVCIARDAKRPNPVGAGVIRQMWNQYLKPTPVPHMPGLPEIILCDIDGTIAERGARGQYEEDKVGVDKPIQPIIDILRTYKQNKIIRIVLFSGRHVTCKRETELWLMNNNIPYDELHMRPVPTEKGNEAKDYVVKEELYRKYVEGKYNVLFVLDDRTQVVDLWRRLGLKCLQVDFGDF